MTGPAKPLLPRTRRRAIGRVVQCLSALAVTLLLGSSAVACPYCQSEIGRKVAGELFNERFWINAAMTIAPVPLLLAIVAIIHFGGVPWLRKPSRP